MSIKSLRSTFLPENPILPAIVPVRFSLVLVALCLFTGCGNNPHPSPLREKREDGSPWKTAYRALPDTPRSLDPQVSYDTLGHAVIGMVYESLLQYHPFKTDPYELTPCLAASLPRRLPGPGGGAIYEIKLKAGLRFHDDPCFAATGGKGREITSEDAAYAFKRMADPKVECPILAVLQEYIPGLQKAYEQAKAKGNFDYQQPIPGVDVVDRLTLRLQLVKPYPQIVYWLAMPFTAPVPREAVEYYDGRRHGGETRPQFKFHPVGSGPFRLAEWNRNRLIRLVRHEDYRATVFPSEGWPIAENRRFQPVAGKPLPLIDEVHFTIIREGIPRWLLFRQGYLDSTGVNKDVFNSVVSIGQELTAKYRKRGVQLHKDTEPSTFYMVFNMEDPVLGRNRPLRQALSTAYNEDLSIEIFSNGMDIKAEQILPPGVFGYQRNFVNPCRQFNLARAKELIAAAGYPNGIDPKTGNPLELTIDVTSDSPESRQLTEFQKNQFEQLGLRIKLEENLWSRQQDKMDSGHFQIIAYGWRADYPDPENFFFLFYSPNRPPQGNNHSRYASPEFDRLFEKMRTMENSPERLKIIHQLNALLVEDCPCVLLSHPVYFSLNQPWCPRVSSNPLLSGGLKYAEIDSALRQERQAEWNHSPHWPLGFLLLLIGGAIGYAVFWTRRHHA
ncbi:MAG: ABC transporter substrate-binding protein [Verrucomicrobiae bacterium]|nr:ABC transporter substrate-binding protein [Verrucomicrobiae bacterium]